MGSWSDITQEASALVGNGLTELAALSKIRHTSIQDLSNHRGRNVICYYSGWLQLPDAAISCTITDDDTNGLMNALHGLDKTKGLDLVLHTPGGDLAATQSIVGYLMDFFDHDVCAFVPQLAMSAGTMIACACKTVYMGRQSSLGPTDPQLRGIAAGGVIEEFEQAVQEVTKNPGATPIWAQIIGQYPPTFLGDCKKALDYSETTVKQWLVENMLKEEDNPEDIASRIASTLCDHRESAMHNRHFSYRELRDLGMHVNLFEDDDELQDKVLTVHHAYMTTFQRSPISKMIESSDGKAWIVQSLT